MSEFETLIGLLFAAVVLAALARKVGAPYPAFLALGGVVLVVEPASLVAVISARSVWPTSAAVGV